MKPQRQTGALGQGESNREAHNVARDHTEDCSDVGVQCQRLRQRVMGMNRR